MYPQEPRKAFLMHGMVIIQSNLLNNQEIQHSITPWAKFRYCTTPQGYLASEDAYTHRFDAVIKDVLRQNKCTDDTLLWDIPIEAAFFHTIKFIVLC